MQKNAKYICTCHFFCVPLHHNLKKRSLLCRLLLLIMLTLALMAHMRGTLRTTPAITAAPTTTTTNNHATTCFALRAGLLLFKGYINDEMIMKRTYLHPITENIPLHAGELMIPPVTTTSDGQETGPLNPGAPQRLGKLYI